MALESKQSVIDILDYLSFRQFNKLDPAVDEEAERGRWGSQMIYQRDHPWLSALSVKPGTEAYDNSCFETSSTAIILADVLERFGLDDQRLPHYGDLLYQKILRLLHWAMPTIRACQVDSGGFAFWPFLDLDAKRQKGIDTGLTIRGPKYFPYKNLFTQLQNNNPADEDDTGLALQAFYKYGKLVQRTVGRASEMAAQVNAFNPVPHYEKYVHGNGSHAAQFADQIPVKLDNVFLVWWGTPHFMPFGAFVESPTMPLNINVVDCVASANAIGSLSLRGDERKFVGPSYSATCDYVNAMVEKGLDKKCAVYYPSPYNLHYAIGAAIESGATCLEKGRNLLIKDIEISQHRHARSASGDQGIDGTWTPFENDEADRMQSSMYALAAYLKLVNTIPESEGFHPNKDVIRRAFRYLLGQKSPHLSSQKGSPPWAPGVHFTAGPFIDKIDGLRGAIIWKSPGFTNAMMLEIILTLEKMYPDGKLAI